MNTGTQSGTKKMFYYRQGFVHDTWPFVKHECHHGLFKKTCVTHGLERVKWHFIWLEERKNASKLKTLQFTCLFIITGLGQFLLFTNVTPNAMFGIKQVFENYSN